LKGIVAVTRTVNVGGPVTVNVAITVTVNVSVTVLLLLLPVKSRL